MLSKWVNCVEEWFWFGYLGYADKLLGLLITEVPSMPYIRKKPEANQDKRLMRLRMGSARRPTLRNALGKSLPASL